jgi:hypothetical protein
MSQDSPDADFKSRVEELIQAVSVVTTGNVSLVNRDTLAEALTHDLGVAANQAPIAQERLDKLESQTRSLADAVIAIADCGPSPAVAPAVEAVKAEMTGETPSVAPSPGEYFDRRAKG